MSEFECVNGHLMKSGTITCDECGAPLHTMDGFTNRQIQQMEKYYDTIDNSQETDKENDNGAE